MTERRSVNMRRLLASAWVWLLAFAACDSGVPARLGVGDAMPEFSLASLDGPEVDSSALAGEIVVLNFWATWCQPCLKEIPELEALSASGQRVVGIALDTEGAPAVRPFVERHGMSYEILLGDQETFQRFGGIAIPYTLVLDRDQKIVAIHRSTATRAELEADIQGAEPAA